MPRTGNKNKRDIILVSAILLFSLALMTLNVKQEKGVRFLDSIVGEVLSPFQNYFAQTLQSISDSINHLHSVDTGYSECSEHSIWRRIPFDSYAI